jgi:RNA polymerase sigma-70 factor (ECF subfamily)
LSLLRQIAFRPRLGADTEEGLVTAARRGDRRAFDALVRRHGGPLRGFVARRVGAGAADDVLQETWLAAWGALPRFAGRSRFKAWLYGIALHKARDHQRAGARQAEEALPDGKGAPGAGPDAYAAVDLKHAVRGALDGLPEAQREVLELYYYAELTLPEIAQALARNLNTVKYQFYRAHALAAEALAAGDAP